MIIKIQGRGFDLIIYLMLEKIADSNSGGAAYFQYNNSSSMSSSRSRSVSPANIRRGKLSPEEFNAYVNKAFNNRLPAISGLVAFSDEWYALTLKHVNGENAADAAPSKTKTPATSKSPDDNGDATLFPSHIPSTVSVRKKSRRSAKKRAITPPRSTKRTTTSPSSSISPSSRIVPTKLKYSNDYKAESSPPKGQFPAPGDRARFGFKR